MNTFGSRLAMTSRPGSSCSVAFITTRGRRLVHGEQLVHEQERVARARVAAEHDDRAGQPGGLLAGGELGSSTSTRTPKADVPAR